MQVWQSKEGTGRDMQMGARGGWCRIRAKNKLAMAHRGFNRDLQKTRPALAVQARVDLEGTGRSRQLLEPKTRFAGLG